MIDFFKYVSPIYNRLDDILLINQYKPTNKEFLEELPHLTQTINFLGKETSKYLQILKKLTLELEEYVSVIESNTGDDKSEAVSDYNKLLKHIKSHVNKINLSLNTINSPYFGKIIFKNKENCHITTAYIGKSAVFDGDNLNLLVTDWRSPIANLYYEQSGPTDNCSYDTPFAKIIGALIEKKQFVINNGRFIQIFNIKSGNKSVDEFLGYHLQERTGKQLEDIVATIQKDQNRIIREEKDQPIIIQGVAGSGKTTILLHKIAYLVFKYKDIINQKDFLVIAPNKTFIKYVSNVLPSLGVYNVQINTFIFWASSVLHWDKTYVLTNKNSYEVDLYKGSIKYYYLIKALYEEYEKQLLKSINDPLKLQIEKKYFDLKKSTQNISLQERLSISVDHIFNKILVKNRDLKSIQFLEYRKEKILKKLKTKSSYITYRRLLADKKLIAQIDPSLVPTNWDKIRDETLSYITGTNKLKSYSIHDLAPILWLETELNNVIDEYKEFILTDEAQDLSEFQILTLGLYTKKQNLILAGDTAQAIKSPNFIESWDSVKALLQKELHFKKITYHSLSKCYRTTVEIIDYLKSLIGNEFFEQFTTPEAVLRHGKEVTEIKLKDEVAFINWLQDFIKDPNLLTGTVAIILKDNNSAKTLRNKLKNIDTLQKYLATDSDTEYTEGIYILSVPEAKGLEFDTVILADYSPSKYKTTHDKKLLYVALTRALHNLKVINIQEADQT